LESELVSGFMTEHAAVIFVFFFLAEYASIVIMCILISILFLGGYLTISLIDISEDLLYSINLVIDTEISEDLLYSISLGIKTSIMIFSFIWVRASFPRIRFDQLMLFCWTVLLPLVIALIILIPCILYSFNIFTYNFYTI
jgi:NADH-ubiquinone oxidoreductase chain 1